MKVLILHPDELCRPALAEDRWDAIFDLGAPPVNTELSTNAVLPIPGAQFDDLRAVKQIFGVGLGRILDYAGVDWWDLFCVEFYEPALQLLRLQRFVQTCSRQTEFFITRAGLHSHILQALCPGRVHVLAPSLSAHLRERARRVRRLRPRQIVQILADKHDREYKLRHFFSLRPKLNSEPIVLLPSAYSNASRMALAYAGLLPDVRFLLIATRESGCVDPPLANVRCLPLAGFASGTVEERELQTLLAAWRGFASEFEGDRNLSLLARAGCFDSVPGRLRQGLAIRDAWLRVFAEQPVASVLCADEMNWHTGLPLLIARSRELPALACHHGALDLRYTFLATRADHFLAKGLMEWDYLVSSCGMDKEKIEIAAPARDSTTLTRTRKDSIILFSEDYEVFGGRCAGFYKQILPALANLAQQHDCELVVKLHPFESKRERTRLVTDLLPADILRRVRVVDGPLNDELMQRAWFGVTVASSAAIDCALRRIPVFLCRWLDFSATGYAEQFVQFGAAKELSSANQIERIPGMLRNFGAPDLDHLWQETGPERLRELILERKAEQGRPYESSTAEHAWA